MDLDLKHLYKILDYSYQKRDKPPGQSVCIVIVPPRDIAEQFNEKGKEGEDESPTHCTVAYIGTVDIALESKILSIAKTVSEQTKPFNVRLGNMDIFENPEHDVWHMQVKGKKLHDYRNVLKHAFNMGQIHIDSKHPKYQPHITLEYTSPFYSPQHIRQKPTGKWLVENAWLWGLSEPHLLQFK